MSSEKKHGLGRGIGSLIGSFDYDAQVENVINKTTAAEPVEKPSKKSKASESETKETISAIYVPIKSISANPNQPRKSFDEESLRELSV